MNGTDKVLHHIVLYLLTETHICILFTAVNHIYLMTVLLCYSFSRKYQGNLQRITSYCTLFAYVYIYFRIVYCDVSYLSIGCTFLLYMQ